MDFLNSLIDSHNIPLLTALILGLMVAISPCPLATNIAAIAHISREITEKRKILINGLLYTLGRSITYMSIAIAMYYGFAAFNIQKFFQQWGDKFLGPLLVIIALFMLGLIKINFKKSGNKTFKIQEWLAQKRYVGSLLLGALFALAFCPYSAVVFFGMLVPLTISSASPIFIPLFFSISTGIPVVIFAIIIAVSVTKIGSVFTSVKKIEKWVRIITGIVFLLVGLYYIFLLLKSLL